MPVKYFFLIFISCPIQISLFGQDNTQEEEPPLSDQAIISLITVSPGEELYASFGHSAIRVFDPSSGYDKAYNYGTFDFNSPGFYQKFLQGKLNYSLSRYDFNRLVMSYKYFNQSLHEQILNISYPHKIKVYNFLNNNYLPDNRFYLYDFFFDNCSSRIRDVFKTVLGDELVFQTEFIGKHKTFRQLLDEYIQKQTPWGDFGIDLVLGIPADQIASSEDYMFLPYELSRAFDNAVIIHNKGRQEKFVRQNHIIFQELKTETNKSWFTPTNLFYVIFILMIPITIFGIKNRINFKAIDTILFVIIGLAGIILALLWFATDHIATKNNLNLLWASPVHIFVPYLLYTKKFQKFTLYYFLFWPIMLTLFLIGWNYLPQQLNIAIIPIILLLILRSFYLYYEIKKLLKYDVERRK